MKNKYIVFSAIGIELVGLIVASIYLGQILDEKINTKGLFLVALPMLCLAGWIFQIVVLAKKLEKQKDVGND